MPVRRDELTPTMPNSYPLDDDAKVSTPQGRLRRQLLKGAVGTAALGALAYVGWTRFLFPPETSAPQKQTAGGAPGVKLGLVSDFPEGASPKPVSVHDGADRVVVYFVQNLGAGAFRVLSAKCTHLGCNVAWQPAARQFLCPCHGAAYDVAGKVLAPPAPKPLPGVGSRVEGGTLYLT